MTVVNGPLHCRTLVELVFVMVIPSCMKTLEDQNISKRQRKTTITIDNVNTVNTFFHVFFGNLKAVRKSMHFLDFPDRAV